MDKLYYEEMLQALNNLEEERKLGSKRLYLFGHCNATEILIDLLLDREYLPIAILDNNINKHNNYYKGIAIVPPKKLLDDNYEDTVVCIVARAYEAMSEQLRRMGYIGRIYKLIDYNSYAEYSLSDETINRMNKRVERGIEKLKEFKIKYSNSFFFLCPFSALGDIYFMLSYLPYFIEKREIRNCMIAVIGNACASVVRLFGNYNVEILEQKDMDGLIQASLYIGDKNIFIPHQDRPYVVDLHKALYVKQIPLEQIYCCGVFGLPIDTKPYEPTEFCDYELLSQIEAGRSVILSPYAKSVTLLEDSIWEQIVKECEDRGYQCYTNVVGDEKPLPNTKAISPKLSEIKSVVERAGVFVGIRSGLCDVLRTANAKMIALYPDYYYCDTKWKAIDMYRINGWENIVVKEGFW